MNIFEVVKQTVTTRQAAEMYGIRVSRNGMAVCPFHNDRNHSMKVDNRFHCFACQADGDAGSFNMRMGNTTYVIGVHFSTESKDTLEDKMKRLMRDDVKTDNF